jgi:glycosyltransferase involved in cell wall biosynthesis
VLTTADQLHVCYCHTPARFAWDLQRQYLKESGMIRGLKSMLARSILHYIRNWDVRSANGVDAFVTNSNYVARRIQKVYRRGATTIYPPVDTEYFTPRTEAKQDFYLTISRLVPYKRLDLIIEAFNHKPDKRLIVIGDGPDFDKLYAMAGPNVTLMGQQPGHVLRDYLQRAKAFVFAAEEDFGIVVVEAQACGTPVIAFIRGGAGESVVEGVTGIFFPEQSVESILQAVEAFEARTDWDTQKVRENAERFSAARFRNQFRTLIESEWTAHRLKRDPGAWLHQEADHAASPMTAAPARRGTEPAAVPL